ncbi:MAG TPA: YlxR family protein [Acidimicrobiales bacterium]|nr:YlxR family protein [Acidimicrobiales bacterium]
MTPTRTCVGCRRARPADRLVRIVLRPGGALEVDHRAAGRGAWLCAESVDCLDRAVRPQRFQRAFRAPVDPDALQRLWADLGAAWGRPAPDVRG